MQHNIFNWLTSTANGKRILGAGFFTTGVTLLFLKSWIWEVMAASFLVLKPNTAVAEGWLKMPVAVPTDIYIFNWTNPAEFLNHSKKPRFQEFGPYRYMQVVEKTNVIWNNNNTVTFNNKRTWYFNKKETNRSIHDRFVTANIVNVVRLNFSCS